MTIQEFLDNVIKAAPPGASAATTAAMTTTQPATTTKDAEDQIRLEIKLEELSLMRDNRRLRKQIAFWVGMALAVEIAFLLLLVVAQSVGRFPIVWVNTPHIRSVVFKMEQWTFNIFTSSVLLQTFGLAVVIVSNLFPKTAGKDKD